MLSIFSLLLLCPDVSSSNLVIMGSVVSTSPTAVVLVPGKAHGTCMKYLESEWITEKLYVYKHILA